MRASRLLSVQMLLQARGPMSARELAAALEVSVRTLYRDADQLAAAGVPIYAQRGRGGGLRLLEGWKTTLTGLTPAEAQAVFLTGLAGPATQLGLGPQVERAQLKLLAALPAPWRAEAQRVSSRFHLDPVQWYWEQEPVAHLAEVAAAVWSERQLAIGYESWTATTRRTLDPLGLVLKAGAWYLVAAAEQQPRTYRIASIREVRTLEARARRPRGFDLERFWAESTRRFERELYTAQATVLATPAGLKALRNLSGAVARAVDAAPAARAPQARVQLALPIESVAHATGQLLRLAPEVEVRAPAALRRSIEARLRQACRTYGVDAPVPRPARARGLRPRAAS